MWVIDVPGEIKYRITRIHQMFQNRVNLLRRSISLVSFFVHGPEYMISTGISVAYENHIQVH